MSGPRSNSRGDAKDRQVRKMMQGGPPSAPISKRWLRFLESEVGRRVRIGRPDGPAHHKKVGRNDPCPCGSGRKYKRCHGRGAT